MTSFAQHYNQQTAAPRRRPLVGITGNFGDKGCELAEGYYQSVYQAGGMPVVLPPIEHARDLEGLLDSLDALVLSGGGDINPLLLGEEPSPQLHGICPQRDNEELTLLQLALHRQMPVLGICRGIQVLGAVLGGGLIQDLPSSGRYPQLIKHSQDLERARASHTVRLAEGSLLRRIFHDAESLAVNSFHHQAVASAGEGMTICAQSPDGVIEAIESTEGKSILGVQWHPETFILRGDRCMMPLFEWLIGEAQSYGAARQLHRRILTLDTHEDTPMLFAQDIRFDQRDERILVDAHKMREGGLDAGIMAAYIPQRGLSEAEHQTAKDLCWQLLRGIDERIAACDGVGLARTPDDLYALKAQGKLAIMKAVENGYALGRDLGMIEALRREGVVYITLCHNGDNLICDAASKTQHTHGGLSAYGRDVVREMNRVGMMVDLSHGGEQSFWQALELSATPIVCSHASCRALCDHPRNLTDEQLRALADRGGVCQITLYPGFLRQNGQATIDDAVVHLLHAVEVAGIDHVGLGTDFDGDGGVPGLADASHLINLTRRLMKEGFGPDDIAKVWGANFLRVMAQVQAAGSI